MKRKLLLLNALLGGMLILGATELYRQTLDANGRYERLQSFTDPKQPPEFPAPVDPAATRASDYMPVVSRLLFSADRNADIVVETAAPEVVSRPALPQLSGLIDFGDGPSALMTAASERTPSWVSVGEKIGDFIFEGVEGEAIKLSWNNEQFTATKDQLSKPAQAPARTTRSTPPRNTRNTRGNRGAQAAAAAAVPGDLAGVGQDSRIGPALGEGRFRVLPGDDSPEGTEHNGFVKKTRSTPFGSSSWWEKKEK